MTGTALEIGTLAEARLDEAERLCRLAFGSHVGLDEPQRFGGGTAYAGRWYRDPAAVLAARRDGRLVGFSMAANWGSFAQFGPLVVHPQLWDKGVASALLARNLELFEAWDSRHVGLCTHADSPKHLHLYGRFGFAPRFLIALTELPVAPNVQGAATTRVSTLDADRRTAVLTGCRTLTDRVYDGLDLTREIETLVGRGLGEALLLANGDGVALCHHGPRSEAPAGACLVKFAAVAPGDGAEGRFDALLDAVMAHAAGAGLERLIAGVDTARAGAYRRLLARGHRVVRTMVAMDRPNAPAFSRPDCWVLDDRR